MINGVEVRGALVQIGPHKAGKFDIAETLNNPYWAPDPDIVPVWEEHLEAIRKCHRYLESAPAIGRIIDAAEHRSASGLNRRHAAQRTQRLRLSAMRSTHHFCPGR